MSERTYTSAALNKKIKALEDEKKYLLSLEEKSATYIEVEGDAEIPAYDFTETAIKIKDIENQLIEYKHALNIFNISTKLPESYLTIDQALVKMAMLNRTKDKLDRMRKRVAKERRIDPYRGSNLVEYTCVNYDIDEVKAEYDAVAEEIISLQMGIDFCNQTMKIELA